jgi:hypothetical protein
MRRHSSAGAAAMASTKSMNHLSPSFSEAAMTDLLAHDADTTVLSDTARRLGQAVIDRLPLAEVR